MWGQDLYSILALIFLQILTLSITNYQLPTSKNPTTPQAPTNNHLRIHIFTNSIIPHPTPFHYSRFTTHHQPITDKRQETRDKIQDTRYKIQETRYKIQETRDNQQPFADSHIYKFNYTPSDSFLLFAINDLGT